MSMSKDLIANAKKQNAAALAAAFKSGDDEQMTAALATFCDDVQDAVLQNAAEVAEQRNADNAIMAARGVHVLTSAEMSYYNALTDALKSENPRAAVTNIDVAMPQTIIDGIIGTIKTEHPLLDRLNFTNTSYLTRIITASSTAGLAQWGKLNAQVTQEVNGALKEINLTLCKLTAFMCISTDLLDLGPQWLDQYVREILAEALAMALETAVVNGDGKDKPIGMIRDVSASANVQDGKYPAQTPTELTELTPKAMGAIVKKIARDPKDSTGATARPVNDLIFVVNPFDYWGNIMPATSYQRPDGTWAHDILPIPADLFQSAAIAQGKAVLGMASKYFVGLGVTSKDGVITQDDSVHFFEDERAYKIKLQGNARPLDEYAFVYIDISKLDPETATPVKVKGTVTTKAST